MTRQKTETRFCFHHIRSQGRETSSLHSCTILCHRGTNQKNLMLSYMVTGAKNIFCSLPCTLTWAKKHIFCSLPYTLTGAKINRNLISSVRTLSDITRLENSENLNRVSALFSLQKYFSDTPLIFRDTAHRDLSPGTTPTPWFWKSRSEFLFQNMLDLNWSS